ncbi:hypothetical protein CDL12_13648 [Handroanthus impetiginosus]|uniref:Uncharacterized protein n=1 Tax=Handroanthus impetiginosus TaxID=429701 RepID=A0A2G9H883_9LAMI|nr:hypothetical protein CDL12_13648 [Handroanthus impetiginosus]
MAFGDDAVRVINMNAIAAMEMNHAENPPSTDEMNANLKNQKYLVKLKKTFFKRRDGTHTQYTILRLFEDKEKLVAAPVSTSVNLAEDHHGQATFGTNPRKRLVFADEESTIGSSGVTKKLKQIVQDKEDQFAQDVGSQLY